MTSNSDGQVQGTQFQQVQDNQQQQKFPLQTLQDLRQREFDTRQSQTKQFGQNTQPWQGSSAQVDQLPQTMDLKTLTSGIRQDFASPPQQGQDQQSVGILRQVLASQASWPPISQQQPLMTKPAEATFTNSLGMNSFDQQRNLPTQQSQDQQPAALTSFDQPRRQSTLNEQQRTNTWQARSQQLQPGGRVGFTVTQKVDYKK